MKRCLLLLSVLWFTLAVELSLPNALPQGSLLLPVCCAVMYWTRSASSLLCCGLGLLLDWIARPTSLPLCPMLLPALMAVSLAPSSRQTDYRSRVLRLPAPLQLPLLTLCAVLLHIMSHVPVESYSRLPSMVPDLVASTRSLLLVALPLSAFGSLMIRFGDEFGLRRTQFL